MAPSRKANKSGSTAGQTMSRQTRDARGKAINEVNEDTHADASMAIDEESGDDGVDPSQGTAVQNMIIGSLNNQKKRYTVNKKQVKQKYSLTKTEVQKAITSLFEEHEEEADTAHSAHLKRLADLIAMKASLESQMTSKLVHLQAMYNTHSRELLHVVESRIDALKK